MRLLHAQALEQGLEVVGKRAQRVGAGGRAALAVAARVVAQHGEMFRQRGGLLIPGAEVAGERVAEGDPRAAALDGVVGFDAVGAYFHGAFLIRVGVGTGVDASTAPARLFQPALCSGESQRGFLFGDQLAYAQFRQRQQPVHFEARKRRALGGALHFDKPV